MATTRDQVKRRFGIIGDSPALNRAIDVAIQVAPTDVTVLVVGENGTGKDAFSKIIHQYSARKHKPFIAINSGAIPEGTIDSELFGHEKGSFTSAYEARKGYFEETNGGVIFLDEIAEMPLPTQARLLRVLESGEFLRVGSNKVLKTDVRVVAATNRNLVEQIRTGKFREDLYFRLNTVTIYVPPLRERGEDIDTLYRFFAADFGERYGRAPVRLHPTAQQLLHQHHWPGNVRELKNFAEKVTVLAQDDVLNAEQLAQFLPIADNKLPVLLRERPEAFSQQDTGNGFSGHEPNGWDPSFLIRAFYELKSEISELKFSLQNLLHLQSSHRPSMPSQPSSYASGASMPYLVQAGGAQVPVPYGPYPQTEPEAGSAEVIDDEESLSLEDREQVLIAKALKKHAQNRKKAAQELGISERTLYRKIKSYGLDK